MNSTEGRLVYLLAQEGVLDRRLGGIIQGILECDPLNSTVDTPQHLADVKLDTIYKSIITQKVFGENFDAGKRCSTTRCCILTTHRSLSNWE